jgi:hypothetical protein
MISWPIKIKIVAKEKRLLGAGMISGRHRRATERPYTLRVKRDHGGGLWTAEDKDGQLYLMVLSRENSEGVRVRLANRATWPSQSERPPKPNEPGYEWPAA